MAELTTAEWRKSWEYDKPLRTDQRDEGWHEIAGAMLKRLEAAEATIKAMKPYIRHNRACWAREPDMDKTCTCGLQALIGESDG